MSKIVENKANFENNGNAGLATLVLNTKQLKTAIYSPFSSSSNYLSVLN